MAALILSWARLLGVVLLALLVGRRPPPSSTLQPQDFDHGHGFDTSQHPVLGYAGATVLQLWFDEEDRVLNAILVRSEDTPSYVARLTEDPDFLPALIGRPRSALAVWHADGVTGATLTARAAASSLRATVGGASESNPFGPLEIEGLQSLYAKAAALKPIGGDLYAVLDADGQLLGRVLRSQPLPNSGYRGPTDAVLAFDAQDLSHRILLLDSYDTPRWIEDLRADPGFVTMLAGRSLEELSQLHGGYDGVEGVSGATMSSQGLVDAFAAAAGQTLGPASDPAWLPSRREVIGWLVGAVALLAISLRRRRRWRQGLRFGVVLGWGIGAGALLSLDSLLRWGQHGLPWRQAPLLALLAVAALLAPVLSGRRLYCRSLCAHGAAQQLLAPVARHRLPATLDRWLRRLPSGLLAIALLWAAWPPSWTPASVAPIPDLSKWEAFAAWLPAAAPQASLWLALIGLVAAVRWPLAYCHYACPTGRLLNYVRWRRHGRPTRADLVLVLAIGLALVP